MQSGCQRGKTQDALRSSNRPASAFFSKCSAYMGNVQKSRNLHLEISSRGVNSWTFARCPYKQNTSRRKQRLVWWPIMLDVTSPKRCPIGGALSPPLESHLPWLRGCSWRPGELGLWRGQLRHQNSSNRRQSLGGSFSASGGGEDPGEVGAMCFHAGQSVVGCWLLVVGCSLLGVGCSLFVVRCLVLFLFRRRFFRDILSMPCWAILRELPWRPWQLQSFVKRKVERICNGSSFQAGMIHLDIEKNKGISERCLGDWLCIFSGVDSQQPSRETRFQVDPLNMQLFFATEKVWLWISYWYEEKRLNHSAISAKIYCAACRRPILSCGTWNRRTDPSAVLAYRRYQWSHCPILWTLPIPSDKLHF